MLGIMRRTLRPRNLVAGVALSSGVVLAQTAYLQGTYVPLRAPTGGDMHGVERWSGEGAEGKISKWLHGLVTRNSGEHRDNNVAADPPTMKRVLIIGDSLVVGIGCKEEPVMPQAICRQLAKILKVDVTWRAVGVNGGDVRTIHNNVLHAVDCFQAEQKEKLVIARQEALTLDKQRQSALEQELIGADGNVATEIATGSLADSMIPDSQIHVDAVVMLCGLNDFKRLWMGRTSTVFRRDLDLFVSELRNKVGQDCLIILPAIPLEETKLPEPLKTFAIFLCDIFDAEKRDMAAREALTHFIPKPAMQIWSQAKSHGEITSSDGVHPNERGYVVFGEYIAREMATVMHIQNPLTPLGKALVSRAAEPMTPRDS